MSVLTCLRKDCNNVMCDRYSIRYGYICNECFDELVESDLEVDEFMETSKLDIFLKEVDDRKAILNEVFKTR